MIVLGTALFAMGLLAGWTGSRLASPLRGVPTVAFYGDWRVACPGVARKNRACELNREVIDGKSRSRVAALTLTRADSGMLLVVTVPLNILIRPGLGLALDAGRPRVYPFTTCLGTGCIARIPVDNALLAQLRKEPQARLQFAAPDRQVMQVAFPLAGFRRADDAARRAGSLLW